MAMFQSKRCLASSTVRLPEDSAFWLTESFASSPECREMRYCYLSTNRWPQHQARWHSRRTLCDPDTTHGFVNARKDSHAKVALYRSLCEKKIVKFPEYFLGYVELGKVYLHERELGERRVCLARHSPCS
jgi:hypothetical protein